MRIRCIFCLLLVAFVGFGCDSPRSRAINLARKIGINELRNDLIVAVTPEGTQHEIPQAKWPESVRQFQPLSVQRHMGGILIVTSLVGREQEGLLIMLDPKDHPGPGGSGVSYDRIRSDGVFWCIEKIRQPAIPREQTTNQ